MSCCPSAPPSAVIGGAFAEANGPESDIRPGESVECYVARSGNTTGLHDDATENLVNKIENTTIPVVRTKTQASVNVELRLTKMPDSRVPTNWTMSETPESAMQVVQENGKWFIRGTWASGHPDLGKTFKIQVMAHDAEGVIDTRSFTVVPSLGDDAQIRLISPLPGAVVNSKFGPRMHPIYKVMKAHTGIDMKYADRSVKDVVAAADGEVILAGGNPATGYGLRVHVKHSTSAGKHLCTTTYNHLAKIYVGVGQKVMAGQKIGLEGSTGGSTGNHLHFECKLPDGKFIDPEPLINGKLKVARTTLENGDPADIEDVESNASLSEKEVEAKSSSCEPFGPDYPKDPDETDDPLPQNPPSGDAFELAWFFAMTHEVGPFWNQSYPSDPEVSQGLIETKEQRKKCGYVNHPTDPGGETKFGVAQNPNPSIRVKTIKYEEAKKTGYNNYWKSAKMPCVGKPTRIAIMLFDMNYMHGAGNARKIYQNSGIENTQMDESTALEALYKARVDFIRAIPRPEFQKGWLKRASECYRYAKSV